MNPSYQLGDAQLGKKRILCVLTVQNWYGIHSEKGTKGDEGDVRH